MSACKTNESSCYSDANVGCGTLKSVYTCSLAEMNSCKCNWAEWIVWKQLETIRGICDARERCSNWPSPCAHCALPILWLVHLLWCFALFPLHCTLSPHKLTHKFCHRSEDLVIFTRLARKSQKIRKRSATISANNMQLAEMIAGKWTLTKRLLLMLVVSHSVAGQETQTMINWRWSRYAHRVMCSWNTSDA